MTRDCSPLATSVLVMRDTAGQLVAVAMGLYQFRRSRRRSCRRPS